MVKDQSVFVPFSLGEQCNDLEQKVLTLIYGYIGKNLAMMQLQCVISLVALNFDLEFATLPVLNLKLKEGR